MVDAETDNWGVLPGLFLHPSEKVATTRVATSTCASIVFISFFILKSGTGAQRVQRLLIVYDVVLPVDEIIVRVPKEQRYAIIPGGLCNVPEEMRPGIQGQDRIRWITRQRGIVARHTHFTDEDRYVVFYEPAFHITPGTIDKGFFGVCGSISRGHVLRVVISAPKAPLVAPGSIGR